MRRTTIQDLEKKLFTKRVIDLKTQCWLWTGMKQLSGYGILKMANRKYRVHRVSAMLYKQFDINNSLLVCHHCDVRLCFNPEHLFIGTHLDNHQDRDRKGRGFKRPLGGLSPKLTLTQVRQIKKLRQGGYKIKALANLYSISESVICSITRNKSWVGA